MLGQLRYVTGNREFGRIFAREMTFPQEKTVNSSRELDTRYFNKLGEVLSRAQEWGELPQQADLLLLIGHLHALYLVTLASYYQGDIEDLDEAELMLHALVRQTLMGLEALPYSGEGERQQWEELKLAVLKRRNLEML